MDTIAVDRLVVERNVWMATTRPDGRPHLAPVWFVYVDDRIWVGTGAGSVRVANLRRNPVASIALEDGDRPVTATCAATIHERHRPAAVVDAFAAQYGWDITRPEDEDVGTVVLVELRPLRWLHGVDLPVS